MRRFRRTLVTALLALLPVLAQATPAAAYTNDYPWRTAATSNPDSFGFGERQCVSYAAWRLYKVGHRINNHTTYQGHAYVWGNASHWDATATALHLVVSHRPRVGAIAQWHAYESSTYYPSGGGVGRITAGSMGHNAWVAAVYADGSVLVEQYNMGGTRNFSVMRVRAPRYLYV